MDQFTNECKYAEWILTINRNSFIVQYPEPVPNIMHKWFIITDPESDLSEILSDEVGEYLVRTGWVEPELSDEEYQIQIALGSIDCRVYKIAPAHLKKLEK